MSRPKAWNGSQWVDPSFWTGTEWKTYIPPAYDVPVGQWTFDSGADGWNVYGGGYSGGAIYADTPGGWYANVAQVASPIVTPPRNLKPNVPIRCRFLWSTQDLGGVGYGDNRDIKFTFWYQEAVVHLTNPTNGAQWYTHPLILNSNDVNSNYGGELYVMQHLWGTNDDVVRMYLHECRLEDSNTGEPLYRLGNPGWEPRVKHPDGTWK